MINIYTLLHYHIYQILVWYNGVYFNWLNLNSNELQKKLPLFTTVHLTIAAYALSMFIYKIYCIITINKSFFSVDIYYFCIKVAYKQRYFLSSV